MDVGRLVFVLEKKGSKYISTFHMKKVLRLEII